MWHRAALIAALVRSSASAHMARTDVAMQAFGCAPISSRAPTKPRAEAKLGSGPINFLRLM